MAKAIPVLVLALVVFGGSGAQGLVCAPGETR